MKFQVSAGKAVYHQQTHRHSIAEVVLWKLVDESYIITLLLLHYYYIHS